MRKTFLITFSDLLDFSKQELQRIRLQGNSQRYYYEQKKKLASDNPEKLAEIERKERDYFRALEARQNALFCPNTYWDYRIIKFTPKAYLALPNILPHVHIRMTEEESMIFDKCLKRAGYSPLIYANAKVAVIFNDDKTKVVGFKIKEYKEVE